jgi:predicted transcriptional regulator
MADSDKLALIADVAANYLRRNSVGLDQIGSVMSAVTRAVERAARDLESGTALTAGETPAAAEQRAPAVPVKRSVQRDHLVCLEDGMKVKTLKRHLKSAHGMTPEEYRDKWGLPRNYPMAAPAYSERRSEMAKQLGLGQKMQAGRAAKRKAGAKGGRRAKREKGAAA